MIRPALAATAAGLIVSAAAARGPVAGWGPNPWSVVRHPDRQRSVAPVHEQRPIHYPRSARVAAGQPDAGPEQRLLHEFFELHTAMAYEEAAVVAERLIVLAPELPQAHYNHACVMGRLHRVDAALDSLERAIELGWRDLVHLSIDPDLDSVRGTERYDALLARLRRALAEQDAAAPPSVWPARIADIYRAVPPLLAEGRGAATVAIIDKGRVVWRDTIGHESVRLVANRPPSGDRPIDRLAAGLTGPAAPWSEIIVMLGLESSVPHRPQSGVLELARAAGDGVLILRWSPEHGCGVAVVAADRGVAGRIAGFALGTAPAGTFPAPEAETGGRNPNR